jgi:hypothetical protein
VLTGYLELAFGRKGAMFTGLSGGRRLTSDFACCGNSPFKAFTTDIASSLIAPFRSQANDFASFRNPQYPIVVVLFVRSCAIIISLLLVGPVCKVSGAPQKKNDAELNGKLRVGPKIAVADAKTRYCRE